MEGIQGEDFDVFFSIPKRSTKRFSSSFSLWIFLVLVLLFFILFVLIAAELSTS